MASIRSLSSSRTMERPLNGSNNRTGTSLTPSTSRKLTLTKTSSVIGSATRPKTPRTLPNKYSAGSSTSPANLNGYYNLSSTETLVDNNCYRLASTNLNELPPVRLTTRTNDVNLSANSPMNRFLELQRSCINPTSSNRFDNSQFSLDSFDTIRTVGTGK